MSGGTKQQFKQFSITCAEDACLVLGMLISGMSVNLEKYKEYASEAKSLLESNQEEFVSAKEYGFAKYMHDALPNATYIGFTGTPVESKDANTPAVFGNYIDIYDIAQAVEDIFETGVA